MDASLFRDRFSWSVGVIYTIAALILGITFFTFWLSDLDGVALKRFQYDFFAVLSHHEMKYDRKDAEEFAHVFLAIPQERIEEDFNDLLVLRAAALGNNIQATKERLVGTDFSKQDRISTYAGIVSSRSNYDRLDTFSDERMRAAIFRVLNGGEPPMITKTEMPPFPFLSPWFFIWVILIAQFAAFSVYAFYTRNAETIFGYSAKNYNPLLDLPKGSGSKLALLITVPGSIPVMALVLLLSLASIAKKARAPKQLKKPSQSAPTAESSKEALKRLKARANRP